MKSPLSAAIGAALILLTPLAVRAADPVVSNISAVQRAGTQLVDITYDMTADTSTVSVGLAISSDGGTTYSVPASTPSGAIGFGVARGTGKVITWNPGADWTKQYSSTIRFKVTAYDMLSGFSAIPNGSFQMGGAQDGISDAPTRTVTLSAFYLGQNLVTKADWGTVRTWGLTHGYTDLAAGTGKASNHPVQTITWYDMVKWCNARSEMEGLAACYTVSGVTYRTGSSDVAVCNWAANGYRLPTEAEWEKAARGGLSGKRFPWGDTISESQANYYGGIKYYTYDLGPDGLNSIGSIGGSPYTSPVGSFPANGYGLYDMAGNIEAWCWDWYGDYAVGALTDPRGANAGPGRVYRGGSCTAQANSSRVAIRAQGAPGYGYGVGFRVARSSATMAGSGFTITSNVTVDTRSAVATLSSLALSTGTLSPTFATATTSYTASVPNATTSITVRPIVTDTTATIQVNGTTVASGTASGLIALSVGANVITTVVTAQDGTTQSTYTVTVTRISNVSTLSGLVLGSGTLSPTFAVGTLSYTGSVPNATSSITVTPTVTDSTATIKVNGTTVASGVASQSIPLVAGSNAINVVVTAQDGTTTSTYTVTVTRSFFEAVFTSATTVPISSSGYNATGNAVNLTLGFAPPTGTDLMVVKNTGLGFITGRFSNLAQGQVVNLAYNGVTYKYVANYYGGTGNDLVLHWAYQDLATWGYNEFGQLGNNSFTDSGVPVLATQSGVLAGKTVVSASAGIWHCLALCSDGTVAAWGDDLEGELGNNRATNSSVPVLVTQSGVLAGKTVIAVDTCGWHSLALCSDGTVAAWGANTLGQLGNGSTTNSSVPVLVNQSGVLAGKTVVQIAAGADFNLALCSDGSLATWGYDTTTQHNVPVLVTQSGVLAGKAVVSISGGRCHSLALCSDGTLVAWGYGWSGQLGNNSTTDSSAPVLVTQSGVLAGKTIISVAAGTAHNLALCSDGTLAAWGWNVAGQLGNNSTTDSLVPVLVTQSGVLAGKTVVSISAGQTLSLALCSDGTLAAWGFSGIGLLGNGGTTDSSVPVLVTQSGVLAGKMVGTVSTGGSSGIALAAVPNTSNQLSNLTLSSGPLSPTFDPATIAYTASVLYATSSITVTPTSAANVASVSVNGTPVTTGSMSQSFPLAVGSNIITTVVTAPDGVTTKTYTVTVTRAAPPVVTNISATQRAGTRIVDITYDMTADFPTVWIGLEISMDGGATYSVPATTLSGAVGAGVAPGTGRVITWDAGADWSGQHTSLMRFKVTAIDTLSNFSFIPEGNFQMGNAMAADTDITDAPIRTVNVSAFYMARNLVTKTDWDTVRTWGLAHGYTDLAVGAGKAADHPVQTITWYDTVKWCNARSEMEGLTPCYYTDAAQTVVYRAGNTDLANTMVKWTANGYRLPTVAEWEKAARGGLNGKRFPWGDTISESQANYYGNTGNSYDLGPNGHNSIGSIGGTDPYTSPVGSFPANGYGLYDMAGNVFKWCWDWYGPYAAGAQTDPRGAATGNARVILGGDWSYGAGYCRVAYRSPFNPPTNSQYNTGFRVVRSVVMPDPAVFSLIPAGSFQMGNAMAADTDITDAPIRTVTTSAFYMARNLVTKAAWDTVRTWGLANGYTDLSAGAGKATNHPVQTITWYDMVKWCNARSEMEGLTPCYTLGGAVYRTNSDDAVVCNWAVSGYRLPSEAEWEKSARGGLSGKRFPWGDTISESQANYYGSTSSYTYDLGPNGANPIGSIGGYPQTSPVSSFPANGYGLYEMAGNVFEWCWDWYSAYAAGAQTDPQGVSSGALRVARGGSWNYYADYCRVAYRGHCSPTRNYDFIGFRVARSILADSVVAIASNASIDTRSTVATLSGLTLSVGTLSPTFATASTAYTASVPNATTSITLTPTATDATATVKVNGTTVVSGAASGAITLTVGNNTITVLVTAQDGTTASTYTVTVNRISTVSTLSSLVLSSGTLSPTFAAATKIYTASVANAITSVTVSPTVTDATATITVNGTSVASGTSSDLIPLVVGPNTITVLVTAQDGTTTTTYTVTVTRFSADSSLAALTLSTGTLSPAFATGTLAYTASVSNATTGLTVTPTVTHPAATVKVNGVSVATGTASAPIPLVVGSNVINVQVTAQDPAFTTSYTVTVTRPALVAPSFTSATTIPCSLSNITTPDNVVNLSLGYAPAVGTILTLVRNTGLDFIAGRFANLAQGQVVTLPYNNDTYRFVVNYFGGTGNDLLLQWADNKAHSWGSNSHGQLGDHDGTNSSVPVAVSASGVLADKILVATAAGSSHSVALCCDGTIAAWGNNTYGQLGDGTNNNSDVPVAVVMSGALNGKTVVAVAAGFNHSLALCSDGTVAAWGFNSSGQLGNSNNTSSNVPVAVTKTGALLNKTVVAVAAGYNHNLARCADGAVVAWGNNGYGQLGNNTTTNCNVPVAITTSGELNGRTVVSLMGGSDHSLALCSDGSLVAWGRNNNGQLGNGGPANSSIPVAVDSSNVLSGRTVTAIATGGWHNLALCSDGTLAAFGRNDNGQLGNNSTNDSNVPVTVTAATGPLFNKTITAIGGGNGHSLALCSDGTLAAWGANATGQLGNNSTTASSVPGAVTRSTLGSGETFADLASGSSASHVMALAAFHISSNPTLANLSIGGGSLSPAFNAATTDYAVDVPNAIAAATVTPTASQANAVVRVDGVDVASGTASAPIPLVVGTNTITVAVTAQDGTTTQTYSFTVTRPPSAVSTLASLVPGSGSLSPAFASATIAYAVSVANATTSLTITPALTDTTAMIQVNGVAVASGAASAPIPLIVGPNPITVLVTAQDETTTSTYTVTVTRAPSAVATLASLALSAGTLSPAFATEALAYTAIVTNATTSITVTPTVTDATATIKVNGVGETSGSASASIPLVVGINNITVLATAQDGTTTSTYTVTVTRISNDSTLSGMVLSAGTLIPVFATGTTAYTASVPNVTSSITVTPTVTDATATVKVNGTTVASGSTSASIPLAVGNNTITVLVTAQDGATTSTYTVIVNRISTVSTLAALTLSSGTLSPGFATASKIYTASVTNATSSITATPTVTDATATITVNGTPVTSGAASAPIPLVVGSNTITVLVTAQDGTTQSTCTVTVLRVSNDSTLAGLTLSTGTLSPVFAPGTTTYASSTAYTTTSITVTPTTNHAAATLTINGTSLASGATSLPIPLTAGPNTIEVKVTAEDGATTQTYTVTVTRPPLYAVITSAASVGLSSSGYTATGNTLSLSLGYAPTTGTNLTVINNTGLDFITGRFSNLAQGQAVALTYNGVTYQFVANYHGGTGNDLVLHWANTKTYAWGYNNQGQLGNSTTTTTSKVPIAVTGTGVLAGKTVIALSCGGSHSLALCADGTVAAWGYNNSGQLGNTTTTTSNVPVAVSSSGVLAGKTVVAIAAGNGHSLALCSDGSVAAWGGNGSGELGNNDTANSSVPVAVQTSGALSGKSVTAIAAGFSHSLALCSDGTVAAWGLNGQGQLGNTTTANSNVPVAVSTAGILSGKPVAAISAGSDHNLAQCVDGTVVAWGYNNRGQLGDSSLTNRTAPVAVSTAGGLTSKMVTAVSAGGAHSLALCLDGSVAAWGYNNSGQLGNGNKNNSSIPVAVSTSGTLLGKSVVGVAAGFSHSLARCSDGTVAAWGDASNGQLGNNTTTNSNLPVAVSITPLGTGGRFMAVAAGSKAMHSVALVPISGNSRLAGLAVAAGSLSPAFSSPVVSYLSNAPHTTASTTVTPATSDPSSTVKVNGTAVASGSASGAISLGSSAVNTITVVVTAQDGVTSTTYTVTIDNTPFGIWQKNTFTDPADLADPEVSGDLATPARDGITNLMKYAMALPPMTCATADMPAVAQQAGYLTLTYRKSKTATDVTYTVQAAGDLTEGTWAPATTVLSQPDQGDHWLVTVRDTVPYAGQARRFMRLQVGK